MSDLPMVERAGRAFRFGDYPDQRFSLTSEEFQAANADLVEVPLGIDPVRLTHYHGKKSVLDGRTGKASGFSVEDGSIHAKFNLPTWLNEVIDEAGLKMSAVFDIATKRLLQIDFTDKPIIPDAGLFAEASTVAIFANESLVPAVGVGVGESAGEDETTTTHELAQQMHEVIASGFPGLCNPDHGMHKAGFCDAGKKPHHLMAMHDFCLHHGAQCSGSHHAGFALEDYPVADENERTPETQEFDTAALFARLDKLEKENLKLSADNARIKTAKVSADAAGFSREFADRITPTAQPLFVGLYEALAAADDVVTGVVGFSYGKDNGQKFSGSRVELLKQAVAALKPHQIGGQRTTNDAVGDAPTQAGFAHHPGEDYNPATKVISDERKAELRKLAGLNN